MKRLLAFVMTVVMLTSCFTTLVMAANTSFTDVPADHIALTAIKTLNQMKVINGYPDGTFGPDKNVTRAEFTAMLMRFLGVGGIGPNHTNDLPFTDVDVNNSDISWAIPDINTAYAKGIINGYEDNTFRPSANVAYEEAIKMIVCTLGYVMSVDGTPWYSEYLGQAAKLGILQTASSMGAAETPATRACIAQMLYDALEVNLVENQELTDKTILTDYLGYTKGTGKIASDGITGLSSPDVFLRDNEVQIDNGMPTTDPNYEVRTYQTEDADLKNYLGYELDYYYKDNGSNIRTLAFFVLKENEPLKITDAMLDVNSCTASQIRYYKTEADANTTVVNLDPGNVVVYNGKLYGTNEDNSRFKTSMLPKVGSMELIDSNGDNKYDVVKIEDYTVYYVSQKVSVEKTIIDDVTKTGADKKLILDIDANGSKTTIVNTSGQTMTYDSIATGDIICFATSNVGNGGELLRKAVVVKDNIRGTVTGTESEEVIIIDGTRYRVSKAAPWLNGTGTAPALRDVGVFSKDSNGDVVVFKKDAVVENVSYGYIMGYRDIGNFETDKEIRILTGSGSVVQVRLQDNVLIDGKPMDAVDAMAYLENSAKQHNKDANTGLTIHQMIKFTTKASGGNTVLDKVYTAASTDKGQTIETDKLYFYNKLTGASKVKYNSGTNRLTVESTGEIVDVSGAIILVVPSDRTETKGYKKSATNVVFKNGGSYYVEMFDVSTTNVPKVIVCYGGNSSSKADSTTPLSVVSKQIAKEINSANGESMNRMSGFKPTVGNSKATMNDEWISLETPYIPTLGDIFRAGTDDDGYASIENKHVVYSPTNGILNYGKTAEPVGTDFYDTEYSVLVGSVIAVDDTNVMILPQKVSMGDVGVDTSSAMTFAISKFSNAQMLLYDAENKEEPVKASTDYQGILKGLITYDEAGITNPSKVIIYMVHNSIVMCAVLDKAE